MAASEDTALRAWDSVRGAAVDDMLPPMQKPLDGFYDELVKWIRHRQARLARAYGISGFVYVHKWTGAAGATSVKEGGDSVVEAMLHDGEPDIPFSLLWSGGASEPAPESSEAVAAARAHFDYCLRFFRHRNYILRDNKPLLFIDSPPPPAGLLEKWRRWVTNEGFDGLEIAGIAANATAECVMDMASVSDTVVDWRKPQNVRKLSVARSDEDELHQSLKSGAARTAADGDAPSSAAQLLPPRNIMLAVDATFSSHTPSHPSALRAAVHAALAATSRGDFIFLNAWNDWQAGAAVEPSSQFGRAWIRAIRAAIAADEKGILPGALNPARVPSSEDNDGARVCVIIRVRARDIEAAAPHYENVSIAVKDSLRRTIRSLQGLRRKSWRAWIVDAGAPHGEGAGDGINAALVETIDDARVALASDPELAIRARKDSLAGAAFIDAAISQHCSTSMVEWGLVADSGSVYAPDALDFLPADSDAVIMNAYASDRAAVSSLGLRRPCCTRGAASECFAASPKAGFASLGAIVFRVAAWALDGVSLEAHGACSNSLGSEAAGPCDGGTLAEHLETINWRLLFHPLTSCALAVPHTHTICALDGGFWWEEEPERGKRTSVCAPSGVTPPLPLSSIDWNRFFQGGADDGCICEQQSN